MNASTLLTTIVYGLIGFGLGWLAVVLSDFAPRYAQPPPDDLPQQWLRKPALLRFFTDQNGYAGNHKAHSSHSWLMLEAGVESVLLTYGLVLGFLSGASLVWTPLVHLGIVAFLLLIALIDLKYRLVPNVLIYPALVIAALAVLLTAPERITFTLVGAGLAFGVFALTAWLQPGKLGGGDVKLAALLGIAFGFPGVLWALLVGGGVGGLIAGGLLLSKRPVTSLPYAPFLCLGAWIALLYNPFASLIS
jgi:leader peptidase (prepilin peptidase)/N-methyltransferase